MIRFLRSPCPWFSGKTAAETHVFQYVPATVDGKSLSFEALKDLVKKVKPGSGGHSADFRYIWDKILKQDFAKKPIEKGYWIAFTRENIPGSGDKLYADQCKLFEGKPQYCVPDLLSASVCVLMERICRGTRLYPDVPLTYTRLAEVLGRWQLVLGGFSAAGLCACPRNYLFGRAGLGVAGLRKF